MKFIKLQFKDRFREIGYLLTNSGITISSIEGIDGSMEDNLTALQRNHLIIKILQSIPLHQ